ncbi:hypothetical protein U1Q18_047080 [Sarracenia purpurea var. burkii]
MFAKLAQDDRITIWRTPAQTLLECEEAESLAGVKYLRPKADEQQNLIPVVEKFQLSEKLQKYFISPKCYHEIMEAMNEEMNRYNTIAHKPRSTGELKQLFETTKTPGQKVTKEQQVIRQIHETQTIPEASNTTTSKSKAPNWLKKARGVSIEDVGSDHEADGNPNSAKTDSGKKSTIKGDLNPKKSTKSSKQPILADTQAMGSPISSNMSNKTVSDMKNITILRRNENSIGAKTSEINLIEPIDNARCGKTIDPIIEAQIITEKT